MRIVFAGSHGREMPQEIVRIPVQQFVQDKRVGVRPRASDFDTPIAGAQGSERIRVQVGKVDPLPHGWSDAPIRFGLESDDLATPVVVRFAVRPSVQLQDMGLL
jgi:hypothetical protein